MKVINDRGRICSSEKRIKAGDQYAVDTVSFLHHPKTMKLKE